MYHWITVHPIILIITIFYLIVLLYTAENPINEEDKKTAAEQTPYTDEELKNYIDRSLEEMDVDNDGYVTFAEYRLHLLK